MARHGPGALRPRLLHLAVASALCAAIAGTLRDRTTAQSSAGFADRIAALSETGGHFDTDNLISNERSYLRVLPALSLNRRSGGAYLGVGPDQNFSYIAALRPSIAFIVDIRRDNMLLHLLFKAIFELARTPAEYLALLTGRPNTGGPAAEGQTSIERIVERIDAVTPDPRSTAAIRSRVEVAIARARVPLSVADRQTIDRFHRRFIAAGLNLRFESTGRPPRSYYPTYRELLLARDSSGRHRNFLASDESFRIVKDLHASDRIIPVIGDVSGGKALAAIARTLTAGGERVSTFYVSNVEFYLFYNDRFSRFVENLRRLPRTGDALLIRSLFNQYAYTANGGDQGSASELQPMADLLQRFDRGRIRRYTDLLVNRR